MQWSGSLLLPSVLLLSWKWSPLGQGDLLPPMGDPPDASEEHSSQRYKIRNVRQHTIGEHRQRILWNIRFVSERLEGHGGEQQYGRTANFFQAVDVIHIIARIVADSFLRFRNQFIALSEFGRACR